MQKSSPTYLYLRNGIYYFQLRIPKTLSHTACGQRDLIRRSTRTGNKREALKVARRWWIEIMTADNDEYCMTVEKSEAEADRRAQLYDRGKFLYSKLEVVDPKSDGEINGVMEQHFLSEFDMEAFNYYQDHLIALNENIDVSDVLPVMQKSYQQRVEVNNYPDKKLSELVQGYVYDHSNGPNAWRGKTKEKYERQLSLFVDMAGDPMVGDLTVDLVAKQFSHRINNIPIGICKKIFCNEIGQRKPIDDIIEIARLKKQRTLSESTVWTYISTVKSLLRWASKRRHIPQDLDLALERFKKPTAQQRINRLPFTKMDLEKIFYTDHFMVGRSMRKIPQRYWIPLVSLYSGARLGEISQLDTADIIQDSETKIWYLNITDEGSETKKLKTLNSKRHVPVHHDLIKLGFLRYLEFQKNRGNKQLFLDLSPNKLGDWGGDVSKWFSRHLKKCGVKTDRTKVFHCFRHTVINFEKQNGLDSHVMSEIVGHSYKQQNAVHSVYQQEFDLKRKKTELDKLQYGLDLSKIRAWK